MLRYLLEKEFKQIRRDRFMPKIIFIIPIMQLIILPFAANFEMRNINLASWTMIIPSPPCNW